MNQTRNSLEFQISDDKIKTLHKVAPVELFLAAYTDGNGKNEQRILCRPRGTNKFYFLFSGNVESSMRSAAPWLQDQMSSFAGSTEMPVEMEEVQVPVGNPMGDS